MPRGEPVEKEGVIAGPGRIEVRAEPPVAAVDDFDRRHFQQSLRSAGDPESAVTPPAEGSARVRSGRDEVIDADATGRNSISRTTTGTSTNERSSMMT